MRRKLNENEKLLLKGLIERSEKSNHHLLNKLETIEVENFFDNDTRGFVIFDHDEEDRQTGKCIANVEYKDEDGVIVSIELNLDKSGNLYELDIWKVDDTLLIKWPKIDELEFKDPNF